MFFDSPLYVDDVEKIAELPLEWYELRGKTVLITGASGMIGTVLIDALYAVDKKLDAGIKIYALVRSEGRAKLRFFEYVKTGFVTVVAGDINECINLETDVDYIFHCASNTHPKAYASDPIGTITTNIIGTRNVLEYALKCKAQRTVFLSSVEIYGENRGDVEKFDETYCGYIDCNTLRAGYPEGKRAGEALCQAYMEKHGMDIVIPRVSRVYGPTMLSTDSKAMAQFIRNSVNMEDIVLKSEGVQNYSYTYVTDVASALLYILLRGKSGEAYNISSDDFDLCLKDIAKILAEINGKEVIFDLPDAVESKGFSKATKALLDNTKIKTDLSWTPQIGMRDGLSKTVELMRLIAE